MAQTKNPKPLTTAQVVRKIQTAIDKGDLREARYEVYQNMVTLRTQRGRHGQVRPQDLALGEWALSAFASNIHDTKISQVGSLPPEKGGGRLRYDRKFTALHLDGEAHGVRIYVDLFTEHEHVTLAARSDQLDAKGRPKWHCTNCGQVATLALVQERGLAA